MNKKLKLEFAPGAFDNFEGTQEELDSLIASIQKGIESGEFLQNSEPVDLDELENQDPELAEKLKSFLSQSEPTKRTLN